MEIEIQENPKLLQENPGLLTFARSYDMAETLLQTKRLSKSSEGRRNCTSDDDDDDLETVIKDTLATHFATVIQRWPAMALKVLDNQIEFKG